MLRQEKGAAMPLVLMLMFVLTLLGTALWHYSMVDATQVARDERKMQAYYIARSGAENVAQHIINENKEDSTFVNKMINAPASDLVKLDYGDFEVDVYGNPNAEVIIESTGWVGNISQTVVVTLVPSGGSDYALKAKNISVSGKAAHVYGDVAYAEIGGDNFFEDIVKEGEISYDPEWLYTSPTPPTLPLRENIVLNSTNDHKVVNENGEYNLIDISGGNLDIIVEGTRRLYAHEIKVTGNGKINVTGNGKLYLYLDNFTGGGTFAVNDEVDIFYYVTPGGVFDMSGTPNLFGAIHAPDADVKIAGNVSVTGSVIANKITGQGSFTVVYQELDDEGESGGLALGSWQWKE
ncbi:pilus assembly PilX N-terminal domain-containing protein [Dethiobacter alkaliphilus]|uniref:DUF7305 domain-containing protein n=1 Tax=Dethiobacter alkaliphilus AHT 1 TaxID=555088 RepID=C0GE91_DETAL|nr:pilus assembly PilX N-terminal domain-containing protein [Dethiobacter alkaliphilus]EEG78385.1 hypothetical protein DealDRAFT_0800 [Dethiobacter alkaliphilus AHT 1]